MGTGAEGKPPRYSAVNGKIPFVLSLSKHEWDGNAIAAGDVPHATTPEWVRAPNPFVLSLSKHLRDWGDTRSVGQVPALR